MNIERKGFSYMSEEDFEECFLGLRGCIPNKNNSDYSERKINLFMTFTNLEDTDSEVISKELLEFYIEGVKEDIKKQDTSNFIVDINVEVDCEEEPLVFFDIIIKEDISKNDLREFLLNIEKNIV